MRIILFEELNFKYLCLHCRIKCQYRIFFFGAKIIFIIVDSSMLLCLHSIFILEFVVTGIDNDDCGRFYGKNCVLY